ncbi:hypothetical protein ACFVVC_18225 [Pseudarthrobacter sp. NPDC058196]|uniref:hypothetical protein n=1 Tax=Pseudarthrobacter sp. NPDC058196 TaxID=3346376 RepID=UPI0036D9679E
MSNEGLPGSGGRPSWRGRFKELRPGALLTAVLLAAEGGLVMLPVAATAAGPNPLPAANCSVRLLPGLGGQGSNAVSGSSNGLVVGVADTAAGESAPVLWRGGQPTQLAIPLESVVPSSVNRDGVVVGTGYDTAHQVLVGWWWQNGQYHPLPVNPGDIALPSMVSDSGIVVGALIGDEEHSDGPGADDDERPAAWSTVAAAPHELTLPAGARGGHAFAVGADGTVGGVALGDDATPVLWAPNGAPRALPTLTGRGGVVLGIDSTGQALGQSAVAEGTHAVAWGALGLISDVGAAAAGPSSSAAAGAAGTAVGAGSSPSFKGSRPQAMMWIGKSARILPPGSDGQFAGVSGSASSISGQGATTSVIGYSAAANGLRRATEWSCK